MGSGFSKFKKQAKLMEQHAESEHQTRKLQRVIGSSGNGLVVVTLDGTGALQDIHIQPSCVDPQDVEGLQDLIKAAFTHAVLQIEA